MMPPRRQSFKSCGHSVFVHHRVHFGTSAQITLGDDIYIGPYCKLYGMGGLVIGSGTVLGENVTLIASNHKFEGKELTMRPFDNELAEKRGIIIGQNVWVGQNVTVLPGVNVADGSIIGAGSVVTHDTVRDCIYAGNPAKLIRRKDVTVDFERLASWASQKRKLYRFII